MGSQASACGCKMEDKIYSEVSLSRKGSNMNALKTKDSKIDDPIPLQMEEVEESMSNSPSKQSSAKDTSHSANPFKSQLDLDCFSPQAQLVIESMELDLPDKIRTREDVQMILETEERKDKLRSENFNYFGGITGDKMHGIG